MTIKNGICLNQDTSKESDKNKTIVEERDWLQNVFDSTRLHRRSENFFKPELKIGSIYKIINAQEYNLGDIDFKLKNDSGSVIVPENTTMTFLHIKTVYWKDKIYARSYDSPPEKIKEEKCYCFLYDGRIHWCTGPYLPYLREVK